VFNSGKICDIAFRGDWMKSKMKRGVKILVNIRLEAKCYLVVKYTGMHKQIVTFYNDYLA
jgi:hypothetical protein